MERSLERINYLVKDTNKLFKQYIYWKNFKNFENPIKPSEFFANQCSNEVKSGNCVQIRVMKNNFSEAQRILNNFPNEKKIITRFNKIQNIINETAI